jgi:putative tryptophan/tyrosine transport system substrate-binding protein
MNRRTFVGAMACASGLAAVPLSAFAQQPAAKVVKIGVLRAAPDAPVFRQNFEPFHQSMRESGFVEGKNFTIEYRVRPGTAEEISGLAAELVRLQMDAIVAIGPAAVRAAAGTTKSTPIVAVDLESDPMAEGFVTGLARPGGNVTGLFLDFPGLSGKWIELLREMVPRLSRITVAWDPSTPPNLLRGAEAAARTVRVQLSSVEAPGPEALASAFQSATSTRAGAMLVLPSTMVNSARRQIIEIAAKYRMPTIMAFPEFAAEGGLIAYGPNVPGMFRQAAEVMVKVLRGTSPGAIPVERPARFELIVNRKTAASLGLTVSRALLARADRVIE